MADRVHEFDRYRQELLTALGNREPVGVLRQTLAEVERAFARPGAVRLRRSPGTGEWHVERGEQSVREIVAILAGHDCIHLEQLRRGLAPAAR